MWKKGQALVPSWIAFAVIGLLEHHFGRLVDYDFTAAMEDELDAHRRRQPAAAPTGWPGSTSAATQGTEGSVARSGGLKKLVGDQPGGDRRPGDQLGPGCSTTGRGPGRPLRAVPGAGRGDGASRSGPTCPTTCRPTSSPPRSPSSCSRVPQEGRSLGVDPVTGHEIVAKEGRYGPVRDRDPARRRAAEPTATARQEEGAGQAEAAHRLAVQVDDDRTRVDPRGRAAAAVAAPAGRHRPGRAARRSPRRTAGTGRT